MPKPLDLVEAGEQVRVLRNGKAIAGIVPATADLPSWKRRKAQPLLLDGVSLSRMILERPRPFSTTGRCRCSAPTRFHLPKVPADGPESKPNRMT